MNARPLLLPTEAILEVEKLNEPASFFAAAVEILSGWLPAKIHGFSTVKVTTGQVVVTAVGSGNDMLFVKRYYEYASSHPVFRAVPRMAPGWVVRTTDLVQHSVFRRTAVYRHLFVPSGVEFDISANCMWSEDQHTLLTAWRGRMDFTLKEEQDLGTFAKVCGQTFSKLVRNAARRMAMAESLPRLREYGLTARENEVLAWIAEGKTNPEIATILGLSARTVHKHVEHILRKLRVETRTCAAALLMRIDSPALICQNRS